MLGKFFRACISAVSFFIHYGFVHIVFVVWALTLFLIIIHVYLPNVYARREMHFYFNNFPINGNVFAVAEFALSENGQSIFTQGQPYCITFHLRIPDSIQNSDSGMSAVQLLLFDASGESNATLSSTLLPTYRPWVIHAADTLMFAPLYLMRLWEKEQIISVVLAEYFVDLQGSGSVRGILQLTANNLRWYSASLTVSAQLSTLMHLLYHHTWIAGLVFVTLVVSSLDVLLVFFLVFHHRKLIAQQISSLLHLSTDKVTDVQAIAPAVDETKDFVDLPLVVEPEIKSEGVTDTASSSPPVTKREPLDKPTC